MRRSESTVKEKDYYNSMFCHEIKRIIQIYDMITFSLKMGMRIPIDLTVTYSNLYLSGQSTVKS